MQRKRFFRWCQGLLLIAALGPSAASGKDPDTDAAVQLGERFIDAFYSWQAENLQVLMAESTDTTAVLYYQRLGASCALRNRAASTLRGAWRRSGLRDYSDRRFWRRFGLSSNRHLPVADC